MKQSSAQGAKKRLGQMIYGRAAVILTLILLQLGFIIYGITMLQEYMLYIYGVSAILGVLAVIAVINEASSPEYQTAWILCILLLPMLGILLYIYVRAELGTRFLGKRLRKLHMQTSEYMEQDMEIISYMKSSRESNTKLSHFLFNELSYPTYGNTQMEYFPLGEHKFDSMVKELKKAKRFIFMEYFIVEEGLMWDTILEILEQKAQEGVEVRFMYDGMCSLNMLPFDYPAKLKAKGIQCKMFNPLKPVLSTVQNNRDHRKICVIDGRIAYTGGVNLADEYINEKERFGHWKDTAIMLRGDAVQSFTIMFLEMWNVNSRQPEYYERYLTPQTGGFNRVQGYAIPYGDSPYDNEEVGREVYLHVLNHARDYVHIMTPYLILDYDIRNTMTRVAKSGVEVMIIMPHIPDKQYAFDLAKTYYKELLSAGVQIYEYTPGFMHAKVFVSDDDTATVGTINLDYRSLYLHYECGVFIYHNPVVYQIEKDFQQTLELCHKVTLTEVQHRSLYTKLKGNLLRLFAPLM